MEGRSAVKDSLSVFCYLAAQNLIGIVIGVIDCIEGAGAYTATAALAQIIIDNSNTAVVADSIRAAFLTATLTILAEIGINHRLTLIMLMHLAGTASTAHSDILECTTEAGRLMSLEMVE